MAFQYHSFLLKLWATEKSENQKQWMASLENISTNERLVFSSIESLEEYLHAIMLKEKIKA